MEAIASTGTETNPGMDVNDLYLALRITCPNAPNRTQFYQWLRLTWCNPEAKRGGRKARTVYGQHHLNRLQCFAKLRDDFNSLKMAQTALLAEMKQNPEQYLEETNNV